MNFLKNLFGKTQQKIVRAIRISGSMVGWMDRNPQQYIDEGFKKCATVYRCVDLIQQSIGSIEMKVKVNGEYVDNHPLKKLLDSPNPTQSGGVFWGSYVAWNRLTGEAYLQKITGTGTVPQELWVWPTIGMEVVASKTSFIPKGYVYTRTETGKPITWDVDEITGLSELMVWKTFNPNSIWRGQSPMEALAFSIDQNNSSSEWNQAMLKNGSVPDGILTTEETLTDDQFTQIKSRMEEAYTGEKNAHASMILEGGLSWQSMGLSPKDMDWIQGRVATQRDIAGGYGVPDQLVPIPGSQTYNNYAEAKLAFWTDTILPLEDQLIGLINIHIAPLFGENIKVCYDQDEIPALEPLRQQRWASVSTATWLTENEKREATGYDPYEETSENPADWLFVNTGKVPIQDMAVGLGENPDDEIPEEEEEENVENENEEEENA